MFRPQTSTPFICSNASWAPSGVSNSTKAKPLCFCVNGSQDIEMERMGPKGRKACLIDSSLVSGLAIKKTHPKKPTQKTLKNPPKNPLKMFF